MDAAFLRRIHYKLFVGPPSVEDYKTLFHRVCALRGIELPEEILSHILEVFYSQTQTQAAAFHPKFIIEHVMASCNYQGTLPQLSGSMVKDALQNLLILNPDEER